MQKLALFFVLTLLGGGILLTGFCLAEEDYLTITTYYPSPHGSYNELQTNKLAVGDTSGNNNLDIEDQPAQDGNIRIRPQTGTHDPASSPAPTGREGEIAYSSSTDSLYVHNGSRWVAQAGESGHIIVTGTNPTCPQGSYPWLKRWLAKTCGAGTCGPCTTGTFSNYLVGAEVGVPSCSYCMKIAPLTGCTYCQICSADSWDVAVCLK